MIEHLSHPANVIAPQHNQIFTVNLYTSGYHALLNIEPCSPAQLGHAWLGAFCCACALRYQCLCRYTFEYMATARQRKVLKRYSDDIFSTGLLSRKKTRTKTNDRKLYPVVVTVAEKIAR